MVEGNILKMPKKKTIIFALDGLSKKIIDAVGGDLPAIFNETFSTVTVDADLLYRGWPEWITGQRGAEIRALYNKPLANGSWSFTAAYSKHDYELHHASTIWEKLNQAGKSVGLFGLPTTYPAPKVDGFCISGSGAGFDQSEGMPVDAFFPPNLKEIVDDFGGLSPELRYANGDFDSISKYLQLEREGFAQRLDLFVKLVQSQNTDVSIFFDKYFAHFAWLLMRDLEDFENQPSNKQRVIRLHLDFIGKQIGSIIERFPDVQFLVVSDHGAQGRMGSINLNMLLLKSNLLFNTKPFEQLKIHLRRKIKRLLPKKYLSNAAKFAPKQKVGKRAPGEGMYCGVKSSCFAARYIPGIFINTEAFGGRILDTEIEKCFANIKHAVNSNPDLKRIGVKVLCDKPINFYESEGEEPTVWFVPVTEPKGFFFESDGPLIDLNKFEVDEKFLAPRFSSMIGGIKDRDAILGVDKKNASYVHEKKPKNLVDAHQVCLDLILEKV